MEIKIAEWKPSGRKKRNKNICLEHVYFYEDHIKNSAQNCP